MNYEPIYTITVMTKLELDDKGWLDTGSQRIVGFRHEFDDAVEVVKENMCDIYETIYNYAVIEKVEPFLYPDCLTRWFYKYNREKDSYEPIEEPACVKHFASFAIG